MSLVTGLQLVRLEMLVMPFPKGKPEIQLQGLSSNIIKVTPSRLVPIVYMGAQW